MEFISLGIQLYGYYSIQRLGRHISKQESSNFPYASHQISMLRAKANPVKETQQRILKDNLGLAGTRAEARTVEDDMRPFSQL